MAEKRLVVGLMAGTSADGVDAALVETDGERAIRLLATAERPLGEAERSLVRKAAARARDMAAPAPDPAVSEAERVLTLAHAEAVRMLNGWEEATLVGFHGATVAHRPAKGWTWQIGDAALLARLTGKPVVSDFRSADVAAGGEGAPLAPGFHRALTAGLGQPLGILNIGGVANLTWIAGDRWGAFDTGPGGALLDDWVRLHGAGPHDADGRISGTGRVRPDVLAALLDHPWFDRPGPKSLDRDDFTLQPIRGLPLADGAATLAAMTAEAVAIALTGLPVALRRLVVTGGGRRNPTLLRMLAERTGLAVEPIEVLGLDGDSLEAQAFAWLAVRSLEGKPISWPETTGVRAPMTGGRLTPPPAPRGG
ncbi:anhydro-N-acetylmuramic acid kinase [Thermaurantiacus sp.]